MGEHERDKVCLRGGVADCGVNAARGKDGGEDGGVLGGGCVEGREEAEGNTDAEASGAVELGYKFCDLLGLLGNAWATFPKDI